MTLKTYIKKLQKIEKEHPNVKVIYSSDAEGNSFSDCFCDASLGYFKNGEFCCDGDDYFDGEINAVCIN